MYPPLTANYARLPAAMETNFGYSREIERQPRSDHLVIPNISSPRAKDIMHSGSKTIPEDQPALESLKDS